MLRALHREPSIWATYIAFPYYWHFNSSRINAVKSNREKKCCRNSIHIINFISRLIFADTVRAYTIYNIRVHCIVFISFIYFFRFDGVNMLRYFPLVISRASSMPSWYAWSYSFFISAISPACESAPSSAKNTCRILNE